MQVIECVVFIQGRPPVEEPIATRVWTSVAQLLPVKVHDLVLLEVRMEFESMPADIARERADLHLHRN